MAHIKYFRGLVRRWLAQIGFGYCCACHQAVDIDRMEKGNPGGPRRCKACVAAGVARTQDLEKLRLWQQNNRGKMAGYNRTYRRKHADRINEQRRIRYAANQGGGDAIQ